MPTETRVLRIRTDVRSFIYSRPASPSPPEMGPVQCGGRSNVRAVPPSRPPFLMGTRIISKPPGRCEL